MLKHGISSLLQYMVWTHLPYVGGLLISLVSPTPSGSPNRLIPGNVPNKL